MGNTKADVGSPQVNRYVADASLTDREARALLRFARRDPRAWIGLVVTTLVITVGGLLWYWSNREEPYTGPVAAVVFSALALANYGLGEWSVRRRVRRFIRRGTQPGILLTSEFGPESVKISSPDISYEFPYASLTHVAQVGDVLVLKPNNHLIVALPMELVPPQDLALIRRKVINRPMRELSLG